MEYQKIINWLDDTTNQPTKFRKKKWVEINYESQGMYGANSDIKSKASMLRSSLCDYIDACACIHVKGTIRVWNTAGAVAAVNNTNKKVRFKNCFHLLTV